MVFYLWLCTENRHWKRSPTPSAEYSPSILSTWKSRQFSRSQQCHQQKLWPGAWIENLILKAFFLSLIKITHDMKKNLFKFLLQLPTFNKASVTTTKKNIFQTLLFLLISITNQNKKKQSKKQYLTYQFLINISVAFCNNASISKVK